MWCFQTNCIILANSGIFREFCATSLLTIDASSCYLLLFCLAHVQNKFEEVLKDGLRYTLFGPVLQRGDDC